MSGEDNLPLAAQRPEIIDPHDIRVVFVDWIVTAGVFENALNVTLGTVEHSVVQDEAVHTAVLVASRLRMSRETATRFYHVLGAVLGLEGARPPQAPPSPPKNVIN